MSKYYTPKIEEFHVGFEYECKCIIQEKETWYKEKVNKSDNSTYIDIDSIENWCNAGDVRVKYLDIEDIESIGWTYEYVCKDDEDCTLVEGFRLKLNDTDEYILYKDCNKYILYYSHVYNTFTGNSEYDILFKGIVKNKSELKKIMDMCGIDRKNKYNGKSN
jgi:hypothetical protein